MVKLALLSVIASSLLLADKVCPKTEFFEALPDVAGKYIERVIRWEPTGKDLRKIIPVTSQCWEKTGTSCAYYVILLPSGKYYIDCGRPF